MGHHLPADAGQVFKFGPTCGVIGLAGLDRRLAGEVGGIGHKALQAQDHGLPGGGLRGIVGLGGPFGLDFRNDAAGPQPQDLGKSGMVWEMVTDFQLKYTAQRSSICWQRGWPYFCRTHSLKLRWIQ